MGELAAFVVFLGIVGAFSAGIVLALRTLLPEQTRKRRLATASAVSALLPTLIPIAAVLIENAGEPEGWIAVIALIVMAAVLAAVIGLPAALWADRRLKISRAQNDTPAE